MSKKINTEKVVQIGELFIRGFSHYEIMRVVGVSYSTVYLYCIRNRQSLINEQQNLHPDEIWTKQDKKKLAQLFHLLPDEYEYSLAFKNACRELLKRPESVLQMIRGTQLGCKKNEHRKRMIRVMEFDQPAPKIKRPAPEYTNIPTPFGIADQLHAGNRILRTA